MLCLLCLTSHQDLDDNKENKTPVVRYCAVSALESSHKAPITDVQWLPPTFEVHGAEGQRGWKDKQLQILYQTGRTLITVESYFLTFSIRNALSRCGNNPHG